MGKGYRYNKNEPIHPYPNRKSLGYGLLGWKVKLLNV